MSALAGAPGAPGAGAAGAVAPRVRSARPVGVERPGVRLITFLALAAYGLSRWATLMRPAPGWRFVGLLALAGALAGGAGWLARRSRLAAGAAVLAIVLLAFPVAGVRWHSLTHLRIAVTSDQIGNGLVALPGVFVPYLGATADVRLDIVLGAAVLVLDAAAVLAFAGRRGSSFGDGRRAAAALPLIALAVVPGTLVRPGVPYLHGLLLFALIAAFVWGERVRSAAAGSAVLVLVVGGIAGALLAPRVDSHRAWLDYRAWAGARSRVPSDRFDWNQTYGPLRWPHSGHLVMTVTAPHADYWKAEDLDQFDGTGWRYGISGTTAGPLPPPPPAAVRRYTQTIQVSIRGMQTPDVIAAGTASPPAGGIPTGYGASLDPGSWVTDRPLGPGTTYRITTYSPRPTDLQLATAGRRYPAAALAPDLTLQIPQPSMRGAATPVGFPLLGSGERPSLPGVNPVDSNQPAVLDGSAQSYVPATPPPQVGSPAIALLDSSPYAGVYALARRLAVAAPTPYAYMQAVMRYLSPSHGFVYDRNPPISRYPLVSFLLSTHEGYCQQFSGAMALLLRMGGVPARVVSGFTSGTQQGHRFLVSDLDAHAWVEVWFPRYGWIRRDPTPSADPALGGTAAATSASRLSGPTLATTHPLVRRSDGTTAASSKPSTATRHRAGGSDPWPVIVGAGVLVILGGLLTMRLAGALGAIDPVAELERAMARTGRPLAAAATLSMLERRMSGEPDAAAYIRALRRARYGGAVMAPSAAQRRALRRELAQGLGLGGRLRALWALPPRPVRHRAAARSSAAAGPSRS